MDKQDKSWTEELEDKIRDSFLRGRCDGVVLVNGGEEICPYCCYSGRPDAPKFNEYLFRGYWNRLSELEKCMLRSILKDVKDPYA